MLVDCEVVKWCADKQKRFIVLYELTLTGYCQSPYKFSKAENFNIFSLYYKSLQKAKQDFIFLRLCSRERRFQAFSNRFRLVYRFDALSTQPEGKYAQYVKLASTFIVN